MNEKKVVPVNPNDPNQTFVINGPVLATDPCYEDGTWCAGEANLTQGNYKAFVQLSDEGDWGLRHGKLIVIREDVVQSDVIAQGKVNLCKATIGVDSGQAGFFAQAEYMGGDDHDWYDECCKCTLSDLGAGFVVEGVVSSSGYGDGGYNLWELILETDKGDVVVGALIDFILSVEIEEDVEEDDAINMLAPSIKDAFIRTFNPDKDSRKEFADKQRRLQEEVEQFVKDFDPKLYSAILNGEPRVRFDKIQGLLPEYLKDWCSMAARLLNKRFGREDW